MKNKKIKNKNHLKYIDKHSASSKRCASKPLDCA